MKYRWVIAPSQPMFEEVLCRELKIHPLLARCLVNRGLTEPASVESFLNPRLRNLADPFLIPDMKLAVDRLFEAHARSERVTIFGDYDVDGVTSSTLLLEFLRSLGWQAECYLPHRMDEGYGLSRDGVENCLRKHPTQVLLAVDCGSTAVETVDWLRGLGVDVIVLDHHQVSAPPPQAVALVNPQRSAAGSFQELCSVGLAFKLAHALLKRGRAEGMFGADTCDLKEFLDLVALGTIADLVPLRGENRILVTHGLERLGATQRPGLKALKRVAQIDGTLGTYEVGFQLAPRLNAAGRLESAEHSLRLLMACDEADAGPLAEQLDSQNRSRQEIEKGIVEQVLGELRARFDPEKDFVIVEGQMLWHIGVVGIVASRVLREFYRPTLVLGGEADEWRGSGRSIEGFDLAAALRECDDLLLRHGGHAMAAGLSVVPSKVDALRDRLNAIARRTLKKDQLVAPLRIDAEVTLGEVNEQMIRALEKLNPTGQGNPGVQLVVRCVRHKFPPRRMGRSNQHAKLWLTDGTVTHEAVWWGKGDEVIPEGRMDVAFVPQVSTFNGQTRSQLKVLDCHEVQ